MKNSPRIACCRRSCTFPRSSWIRIVRVYFWTEFTVPHSTLIWALVCYGAEDNAYICLEQLCCVQKGETFLLPNSVMMVTVHLLPPTGDTILFAVPEEETVRVVPYLQLIITFDESFYPKLCWYQYCRVIENSVSCRQTYKKLFPKQVRNSFFPPQRTSKASIISPAWTHSLCPPVLKYKQKQLWGTVLLSLSRSRVTNRSDSWYFGKHVQDGQLYDVKTEFRIMCMG